MLQVESPEQAARDPLLGGMFENMVVVELIKALWNRGKRDILSFYRDSNGCEVDVVLERQRIPLPIEIKASRTFSPDFLRTIRRFKDLAPAAGNGFVIYGGSDSFDGTDYAIRGFADAYRAVL